MSNVLDAIRSAYAQQYAQFPTQGWRYAKMQRLHLAALRVFLHVLNTVQATTNTAVLIKTKDMLIATGLTNKTLGAARSELERAGLIGSKEINNRGEWLYELLDDDGDAIPNPFARRNRDDFSRLSAEQYANFYLSHLKGGNLALSHDDDYLYLSCPFHLSPKRNSKQLRINLANGLWVCHKCDKQGGMLDFEMTMAREREGLLLSRTEAHPRIKRRYSRKHRMPEMPDETLTLIDEVTADRTIQF